MHTVCLLASELTDSADALFINGQICREAVCISNDPHSNLHARLGCNESRAEILQFLRRIFPIAYKHPLHVSLTTNVSRIADNHSTPYCEVMKISCPSIAERLHI